MAKEKVYGVYSGFGCAPLSHKEAEQKVRDIQRVNAQVGARGFEQTIVPVAGGYKVVETKKTK